MPIDPVDIRAAGHNLADELAGMLNGYGPNADVTALVLVARVRLGATAAQPVDSVHTALRFHAIGDSDDEAQEYLVAALEDALKTARQGRVDPDDLPRLD